MDTINDDLTVTGTAYMQVVAKVRPIKIKTADYAIALLEVYDHHFHNQGATNDVTFTLPAGFPGAKVKFSHFAAGTYKLTVKTSGTDTIGEPGDWSNTQVYSTTLGSSIKYEFINGAWRMEARTGTWAYA